MKNSVIGYLREARLGQRGDSQALSQALRANTFASFAQVEPAALQVPDPSQVDKGQACAWLNEDVAVVATKSNHLLYVHAPTRKVRSLPLPTEGRLHEPLPTDWGLPVGLCATEYQAASGLLALGGSEAEDCRLLPVSREGTLDLQAPTHWSAPAQYRTCAWLTPSVLVTGGLNLQAWKVTTSDQHDAVHCTLQTTATAEAAPGRTRHMALAAADHRLAVLDVLGDGDDRRATLQLVDAQLRCEQAVQLEKLAPVCVATWPDSPAVFAVGGKRLNLVDLRTGTPSQPVWSAMLHNVRSVQATADRQLTVGHDEAVTHLDLRSPWAVQAVPFGASVLGPSGQVYTERWGPSVNTPLAQAWSPHNTRLLAVGGPVATGYTGHRLTLMG